MVQQELEGLFVDLEGALWPSSYFDWPGLWFDQWPPLDQLNIRIVSCDPSLGSDARKAKENHPGDFQAIIKYGRDGHGTEYVQADMGRRPLQATRTPDGTPIGEGMVETLCAAAKDFQAHGLVVEINQFQLLLVKPILAELARIGCATPIFEIINTDPKQLRILRLTNPLSERRARFFADASTRMVIAEAQTFPVGEWDDGLDSLEQARRLGIKLWNDRAGA